MDRGFDFFPPRQPKEATAPTEGTMDELVGGILQSLDGQPLRREQLPSTLRISGPSMTLGIGWKSLNEDIKNHPAAKNVETARLLKTDFSGTGVTTSTSIQTGTYNEIALSPKGFVKKGETYLGNVHSHLTDDAPFSNSDIFPLLLPRTNPNATYIMGVVDDKHYYLTFRTADTVTCDSFHTAAEYVTGIGNRYPLPIPRRGQVVKNSPLETDVFAMTEEVFNALGLPYYRGARKEDLLSLQNPLREDKIFFPLFRPSNPLVDTLQYRRYQRMKRQK